MISIIANLNLYLIGYIHILKNIFLFRKTTKYCNVTNCAWIMQSFNVLNCQWCWWLSMPKCTLEKKWDHQSLLKPRGVKKKKNTNLPRFHINHEVNLKRCKREIFCQTHNVHVLKQEWKKYFVTWIHWNITPKANLVHYNWTNNDPKLARINQNDQFQISTLDGWHMKYSSKNQNQQRI